MVFDCHNRFDNNNSQLLARGATVDNLIGILFVANIVLPCHNFKLYISRQHEDYLDGKSTNITHEALMTSAKHKYDWLKTKGLWGAKSPNNKKIVAMTAIFKALMGQLKLDPKLSTIANMGKKDNKRGKQKKNKKNPIFVVSKRGIRHGRRNLQNKATKRKRKFENILSTGASTIWCGPSTSLWIASLVSSTRKSRSKSPNMSIL